MKGAHRFGSWDIDIDHEIIQQSRLNGVEDLGQLWRTLRTTLTDKGKQDNSITMDNTKSITLMMHNVVTT